VRIGLLRRRWSAHGGAERFTDQFMAALVRHGHEVHLFAARWDRPPAGVAVHRVPVVRAGAAWQVLSYAWLAPHLARGANVDRVVSFERVRAQDVYRAAEGCHRQYLELRAAGRPLRAALDALRPLHRVILALERGIFRGGAARAAVLNSRLVADAVRRHYAPVAPSLAIVRNGVDLDRFHPERRARERGPARRQLGLAPDDVALLLIGSGFSRKGVPTAVRALGHLRRRGIHVPWLLLAGRGRPGPVRRLARRESVADRVRFLDVVEAPERLYAAADVFVLPSIYDPASNATLEALAMGLPVVTTRTDGSAEMIEHGRSGWVAADARDARALADLLTEAMECSRTGEVAGAARKAVESLTWDRCLQETLAVCAAARS
jgi:UDP-glucose:(heptosyl)LPS alpha-1,3-glucosyltransferase